MFAPFRQLETIDDDDITIGINEATGSKNDTANDEVDILSEELKSLWVEKYAPRRYTELLSEEVTCHFVVAKRTKPSAGNHSLHSFN